MQISGSGPRQARAGPCRRRDAARAGACRDHTHQMSAGRWATSPKRWTSVPPNHPPISEPIPMGKKANPIYVPCCPAGASREMYS